MSEEQIRIILFFIIIFALLTFIGNVILGFPSLSSVAGGIIVGGTLGYIVACMYGSDNDPHG